jgi:hypothetical protein
MANIYEINTCNDVVTGKVNEDTQAARNAFDMHEITRLPFLILHYFSFFFFRNYG